jgi:hypothetical protein
MNAGYNRLGTWLSIALISFLAMGQPEGIAQETQSKSATPSVSNIGFIQDPPAALRARFPMCDAFLKVEWIDKEKMVGYSHYEAIVKNKKNKFKGEKKKVWALVNMKGPHRIDYDVYQYKREGRLEELFQSVREGEVSIGIPMMIQIGDETIALYAGKVVNDDATHPLLSDHRQTVCVPYPDERRVWIIEGKSVGQSYSEAQIAEVSKRVEGSTGRVFPRDRTASLWILDVNRDGTDDFLFEESLVLYSNSNRFYMSNRDDKYPYFIFTFPPGDGTCRIRMGRSYPLITDGKNYYRGDCNLTDLTARTVKE